ncbi:Lrp/AsnC family leucine-responsive transcriptional regulator [Sporosarcina luteola]|nr:Lrp/AsnC family leucine-responsive transcriptional regulator [Sporosarcina luteola]
MLLDHTDFQILQILNRHGRIQWKDIGEQIHMTGQAVGNRIKKLEDMGIIQNYSIVVDETKLGFVLNAFVTVYMNSSKHQTFINFIQAQHAIVEAHRVSGDGCYLLKVKIKSHEQLNEVLNSILQYGNYRLHLSIQEIKQQSVMSVDHIE